MHRGRTGSVLKIKWCNSSVHRGRGSQTCRSQREIIAWLVKNKSKCLILAFILPLLTGVFPFDVGQVGRAGVADGKTLLGHTLIPVHVHEVCRHRDLKETRRWRQWEETSSRSKAAFADKTSIPRKEEEIEATANQHLRSQLVPKV